MTMPYLLRRGERLQRGLKVLSVERRGRHRQFLLSRQLPDGGFYGREVDLNGQPLFEDGVQSELYYTSFAVRALAAIGEFDPATAELVAAWLKARAGRSSSVIDVVSWLYSAMAVQLASGIDLLADAPADWPDRVAAQLERFRTSDGGYAKTMVGAAGSTYHSFLVALSYEMIGRPVPNPEPLIEFVRSRQRDDRGFQANTRVPFSDTLSTFTGVITCLDLGRPEIVDPRRLLRFLDELECPSGGFLAAGWDHIADVEYTFYGIGACQCLAEIGGGT